jgi:hypothetical protein
VASYPAIYSRSPPDHPHLFYNYYYSSFQLLQNQQHQDFNADYRDSSIATLLAHKPLEFKHYAGPPVSISRGQKARRADCAQDPSLDVQVIDLTTQEASEGIADMLKGGCLLILTSNTNSYERRRRRQFLLRLWRLLDSFGWADDTGRWRRKRVLRRLWRRGPRASPWKRILQSVRQLRAYWCKLTGRRAGLHSSTSDDNCKRRRLT